MTQLVELFSLISRGGVSRYRFMEKKMSPLSWGLRGLILEHQFHGQHLDTQNRTTDLELEKKNFAHAGEVLSTIWNGLTIDGGEVLASYVEPGKGSVDVSSVDMDELLKHATQTRYTYSLKFDDFGIKLLVKFVCDI